MWIGYILIILFNTVLFKLKKTIVFTRFLAKVGIKNLVNAYVAILYINSEIENKKNSLDENYLFDVSVFISNYYTNSLKLDESFNKTKILDINYKKISLLVSITKKIEDKKKVFTNIFNKVYNKESKKIFKGFSFKDKESYIVVLVETLVEIFKLVTDKKASIKDVNHIKNYNEIFKDIVLLMSIITVLLCIMHCTIPHIDWVFLEEKKQFFLFYFSTYQVIIKKIVIIITLFILYLYIRSSLPRYKLIDFLNFYWKYLLAYCAIVNIITIIYFM